ncbi:MAG: hypothetical protein R2854_13915 [Caldilineaceae bacterium]
MRLVSEEALQDILSVLFAASCHASPCWPPGVDGAPHRAECDAGGTAGHGRAGLGVDLGCAGVGFAALFVLAWRDGVGFDAAALARTLVRVTIATAVMALAILSCSARADLGVQARFSLLR